MNDDGASGEIHGTGTRPPRMGFFGGSFDPPHRGHLELGRRAVETAGLERLWYVPAARNPHKEAGPQAPGEVRVAMLEAAIGGDPRLGVLEWELKRPPPSRTVETVCHLRTRFSGHQLCWLIGADQLAGLPRWHRIDELVREVVFLVLERPGSDRRVPKLAGLRLEWVPAPAIEASSTEVRRRLAEGLPVDNLVPASVLEVILRHPSLY